MRSGTDWPISEALVRQNASAESFQRGEEYEHGGAVLSLVRRGDTLEADVEGSEPTPYRVRVELDPGGVVRAECTCPYEWGGWCKHVVAALLTGLHRPDVIATRPPLDQMLAGLSRDQLAAIVQTLVTRVPALVDAVEARVAQFGQPKEATEMKESRPERPSPIDARAIRREVRAAIHELDGMRASEAYGQVGGIATEVGQIAGRARVFLDGGDPSSALAVLDAVTAEYTDDWVDLDDSEGELGELFRELGALWAETILSADLASDGREKWKGKLEAWAAEVDDYGVDDAFGAALAALAQGWDDPRVRAMLDETATPDGVGDADDLLDPILVAARLSVLERQQRSAEYLNLARVTGQTRAYLTMLARLGRGDEAIAAGLSRLESAEDALAVARVLREGGELEKALRIGEHGLGLDGSKAALAVWVRDLASGMGERERAAAAAVVACREAPSLATYQAMQELAGDAWPERRAALLDHLRKHRPFDPRGEVDIFLHEGLVDDAIAMVQPSVGSYYGDELVETVVRAAVASHSEWVIATCTRRAEGIMNEGRSQLYDLAVRWLAHTGEAYRVAGREGAWAEYLRALIEQHRRKYRLRPMLEALQRRTA